jgi:hypothetical protein
VETRSSRPMGPGVILGFIGGLLVVIGSFLNWATLSLNITKFAQLLGVDPATLQSFVGSRSSFSVAGTKTNDGKIMLVVGVLCLVGAVLVIALQASKKAGYAIVLITGVIAAGIGVYEIISKNSQIDSALSTSAPALSQAGISADAIKSVLNLSWGIGLWICIGGGVLAAIGGLLGLMSRSEAAVGGATMGGATAVDSAMGSGFGAPAASTPPPATAPVPPPAAEPVTPPATEPVTPPATEPVTPPPATQPVTPPPATEPVTPPVAEPSAPPVSAPPLSQPGAPTETGQGDEGSDNGGTGSGVDRPAD